MTDESVVAQATSSKIEAFLSYAHESDKHLNIAEALHKDLVGMIHLRSQRDVVIFRDKVDLQWGDRFRAALDNGLRGASVLFVIATTHYLESKTCRQEFNDFLNAAKATGRSEARRLILPIMPLTATGVFHEESEDPIAREIASIQYEPIEDAVLAGPGTTEWKRALMRLADRFIRVVEAAEAEAAAAPAAPDGLVLAQASASGADEEDRGYFDIIAEMEQDMGELTELSEKIGELMGDVVAPMSNFDLSTAKTAREMNGKLSSLAMLMQPKSIELGDTGREMRDKANSLDVNIRQLVTLTNSSDLPSPLTEGFRDFLKTTQVSMAPAENVVAQMEGLLLSMAPAEQVSSRMRTALKPMRSGILAISDAVRIIQKWGPELLD